MAVLNPPGALPGLARSLANYLITSDSPVEEGELASTFSPPGMPGGDESVVQTLAVGHSVGLFSRNSNGTSLGEPLRSRANGSVLSKEAFRRAFVDLLLSPERNEDPWFGEDEARTAGGKDFGRALSWFLAQDALGPALTWTGVGGRGNAEDLQAAQLRDMPRDQRPFPNNTRWGAFSRWAPACGFCTYSSTRASGVGLVPLPRIALRDVLLEMTPGDYPIGDLLDYLRKKLPVLPGGVFRLSLDRLFTVEPPGMPSPELASSIGQTLLILESEGVIATERRGDASRELLSVEEERYVSHVLIEPGELQ
jgi:hypothetical protein